MTETPDIKVNTYRENAPKAAESFGGRGATTIEDVRKATEARREQVRHPGGEYKR